MPKTTHEIRDLQRLATQANVSALPDKERAIVILRLGWDGTAPRSQAKTARHLGLSQPYVSILERSAKALLAQQAEAWAKVRDALQSVAS